VVVGVVVVGVDEPPPDAPPVAVVVVAVVVGGVVVVTVPLVVGALVIDGQGLVLVTMEDRGEMFPAASNASTATEYDVPQVRFPRVAMIADDPVFVPDALLVSTLDTRVVLSVVPR
jgi:hypothetical protein